MTCGMPQSWRLQRQQGISPRAMGMLCAAARLGSFGALGHGQCVNKRLNKRSCSVDGMGQVCSEVSRERSPIPFQGTPADTLLPLDRDGLWRLHALRRESDPGPSSSEASRRSHLRATTPAPKAPSRPPSPLPPAHPTSRPPSPCPYPSPQWAPRPWRS